jgi:anti-sigma B factor antagonist
MSPQHTLSTLRGDHRTVIALYGEVDTANADEVADAVRDELADRPVKLDLSELSFMDSSGLRMLAELVRDASESAWLLTIGSDLPPMIRRLLEMTGMLELLPIEGLEAPD